MCSDRLAEGEAPACVQACPTEAISITVVIVDWSPRPIAAAGRPTADADRSCPPRRRRRLTVPTTRYRSSRPLPADAGGRRPLLARSRRTPTRRWRSMLVLTQLVGRRVRAVLVWPSSATALAGRSDRASVGRWPWCVGPAGAGRQRAAPRSTARTPGGPSSACATRGSAARSSRSALFAGLAAAYAAGHAGRRAAAVAPRPRPSAVVVAGAGRRRLLGADLRRHPPATGGGSPAAARCSLLTAAIGGGALLLVVAAALRRQPRRRAGGPRWRRPTVARWRSLVLVATVVKLAGELPVLPPRCDDRATYDATCAAPPCSSPATCGGMLVVRAGRRRRRRACSCRSSSSRWPRPPIASGAVRRGGRASASRS